LLAAAGAAGLADAHAAAASAASLAARGVVDLETAARGVLAGWTANTATKCVVAVTMGDRTYALEVVPGLLLMLASAWAAALYG
jgi:uncharacterized membrane protein (DUF4010 family)